MVPSPVIVTSYPLIVIVGIALLIIPRFIEITNIKTICVVVFMNIENMLWGMLICFALIIGLIYLLYDITGNFLKRKEK